MIVLDGQLAEAEWVEARVLDDFRVTEPLTRDRPSHDTVARVLAQPEALYIAVRVNHPENLRIRGRSPRDARFMEADPVTVMVDFEGQGTTAYEFTVSLSGSIRDGTVLPPNVISYDWDGVWYSAVAEDQTGWTVEIELPWSVAPMRESADGMRRIGVFVSREVQATGERYSFPAIEMRSPTFVSDFFTFEVPAHAAGLLSWIPYASVTADLLDGGTDFRAGLDVLWKPTAAQQLTATINPDFGQVEADDLVVNFSAIETFFTEKRPFFTQNQQLFDLRTTLEGRLINTRRIGGAPDLGPEGQSDILAAAKYSVSTDQWEYGAFGAAEDDSSLAEGRDYLAARLKRRGDGWSAGYLGTFTDRPALDRTARVHAFDGEYSPAPGWALRGQAIRTESKDPLQDDSNGNGAWLSALYAPGGRLEQNFHASWYDDNYDVNDLGYMARNSIRVFQSETFWYRRSYPEAGFTQSSHWSANLEWNTTDDGERLPSSLEIGRFATFRDGSELWVFANNETSGIDDLTTRGGPAYNLPSRTQVEVGYLTRRSTHWWTYVEAQAFEDGLDGSGFELQLNPQYFVSPDLNFMLDLIYVESSDWLIWNPDLERVTSYARRQWQIDLDVNWYPSAKSEFRAKLQFVALQARARQAFDIAPDGDLVAAAVPAPDFSLGDLGLQLRLRYEFKPLSDLFVVYSYGGSTLVDQDAEWDNLFRESVDTPTAHQLLVKLSYRF
ncbi:MAG: DUF5916 domain-containing protein [Pseudomonadota bacterium]|nr:DUF5916 domain-containing protein [Pseudomonadota bacterium]